MTNTEAIHEINSLLDNVNRLEDPVRVTKRTVTALILAESSLEQNRWIPVTERLPEGHEYVLCCGSKGGQFVGWVAQSVRGKKAYAFLHGGNGRRITHWRPLPEPPKEET